MNTLLTYLVLFHREEMMLERGMEQEIQVLLSGGVEGLRTNKKDALGQFRDLTL